MDNMVYKNYEVLTALRHASPDVPKDAVETETEEVEGTTDDMEDESKSPWKRFDVLPSAPADHAFYTSPSAQTSRNFLGRLHKEYKVLASSLPGKWRAIMREYIVFIASGRIYPSSCI